MIQDYHCDPTEEGVLVTLLSPVKGKKMLFSGITAKQMLDGFIAYQQGKLIQDAYPFLNADQREFLMTGLTPEEWEELFGDEVTKPT